MPVTSTPLHSPSPARVARAGCARLVVNAGLFLVAISFGGIFWAVNGGYSVIGLGVLASSFNSAGALFWAAISRLTFPVPVVVPGLPVTQPIIPWIGVVAASLLQIGVAWMKLSRQDIPRAIWLIAFLVSAYDLVTTYVGVGTITWLAKGGPVAIGIVAIVLTFALEITIGYALRGK